MSFEWQSAQFEVHHDPKLLKWRMKSLSHMPKLYRDGNQLSWMRQRSVSMLTSFLHNCYFSWTLLMLLFLGVGKDLCKIYCWELFRFYFFVDYKKQWRLKKKHIKNRQSRLQGPHGLNYQHYHFHHILQLTLLLYQQLDLSAVLQTTISAFWHTIKRCHTRLLRRCFGSCCQLIKHYLKEVFLAKGSSQPGSLTDSEEGAW